MTNDAFIRDAINRLARLDTSRGWTGDLNPTQRAMLAYLGQANRFSRSPSHVAHYFGATRGTTTQSLKSLQQKGYLAERRSEVDKRVISYDLTDRGRKMSDVQSPLQQAASALSPKDQQNLGRYLKSMLLDALARNNGREFGVCKTCMHHQERDGSPYCGLLDVVLAPNEVDQICHEHVGG